MEQDDNPLQQRHKPLHPLERPRELILACPPMNSQVNLSRIARAAGCFAISRIISCGNAKVISKIARDACETLQIEVHRTLEPILKKLRQEGYPLIALEQTSNSVSLFDFSFPRKCVLIVGNERSGIEESTLRLCDSVVEIPTFGRPYAQNAATATCMALYEYCRQYPQG